jgi:hypothetical protein
MEKKGDAMLNTTEFYSLRKAILEREFSRMNAPQKEAVFHADGPLLILAGAGSGKTTVLVNRIANLIRFGKAYASKEIPLGLDESGMEGLRACAAGQRPLDEGLVRLLAVDPCPAWRILAITFTNKAAGELKERLVRMLGEEGDEVMASTFHSFCARILRREGENLGYSSHFTIYDTDDSRRLMKECMKALNVDEKNLGHKAILAEIGRAKDSLLSPEEYAAQPAVAADVRLKTAARLYAVYQRRLRDADAMDFDDLLYKTVELFTSCPDVLDRYQKRYRYLMVDEYQDTNHAQYRLISLLAAQSGNLCVVGDDDQSIYKFRGATIENILHFEDEFAGCRVIRLEQNYRSTKNILHAANAVIARNLGRKGKTLWTDNPEGDKIHLVTLANAEEESRFIADTILDGVGSGRRYRDFAVLYRANAQSNAIEQALVKSGVPYRIIGGHRFNDTKEVRDAVAYLRVINNPEDTVSLRRILNEPKRGIGDATADRAAALAEQEGVSLYEVLSRADEYADLSRAAGKIRAFIDMMDNLRAMNEEPDTSLHLLYRAMLESTGYLAMWEQQGEAEAGRVENLNELASSILSYEQESEEDYPELSGFLEEQALMTDIDNYDAGSDAVVLMTMHAAKGLEFPVVFLPGFEDGIFPGIQTLYNPDELEEDRRLCYVAITRAMEELYITNALSRLLYGSTTRNRPSKFLNDIPPEVTDERRAGVGSVWGSASTSWGGASSAGWSHAPADKPAAGRSAAWGGGVSWTSRGSSSSAQAIGTPRTAAPGRTASSPAFHEGDRVLHKVFGAGRILAATPMGNDSLLTIAFDGAGTKKIMANFAHLKKMEG